MTSLPGDAEARPDGVTSPVRTKDYLCECNAGVTPPSRSVLYVRSSTMRRSLRDCERGHPCHLPDCLRCGERVALRAQFDILDAFADHQTCISIRLSVDLDPDLDHGHRALAKAWRRFLEIAKLRQTSLGYLRVTEITRPDARWNWHIHLLVIPLSDPATELHRLIGLWEQACKQTGQTPSSHAQISETSRAVTYLTKPRLGTGHGSLRQITARASGGDADAHEDFTEWDAWRQAHPRVRFRSSWVGSAPAPESSSNSTPRDQHMVSADDIDLARMALLTAMGVSSVTEQMGLFDVSESTVKRRRRHFPTGSLAVIRDRERIPFRVSGNEA